MCDAAGQPWFVYVLRSTRHETTYVGVATDVARRLRQHNGELPGGARATRARRPWGLAATSAPQPDRASALRLEHAIKRLRGAARIDAVQQQAR